MRRNRVNGGGTGSGRQGSLITKTARDRTSVEPVELRAVVGTDALEVLAQRAAELVLEQLDASLVSPYLTVKEAAQRMRCSRQRVDDLLSQGRLRRLKDGTRTLVLRAEVDTYLGAAAPLVSDTPAMPPELQSA